jgi:unsaturated rhamnogalacturonyl hydrolase
VSTVRRERLVLMLLAATLFGASETASQTASAKGERWSVRMAESVMRRHPVVHEEWDYTAGLILLALERVADQTGDSRYRDYVRRNMDRVVNANGTIRTYELDEFNLDQINQGRLLFALHERTRDARYRRAAELLREQLRRQPRTREGGFWHKQIYPHQMWLDGLYMTGPFYAQFAQTFGDSAAFDDVAKQFLLVARHTRDTKTGLLYHGWDESRTQIWADKETGQSPNFWGRAMAWYLMALVDVLDFFPEQHRDREAIVRVLRDVADAAARVQDPVTGLWYQVLDQPSRSGNYLEASASSMFVYAFAKGARRGLLDGRYREIAERGFNGLVRHLVTVDSNGLVTLNGICQVAGLGGKQQRDGSFRYYISEPVVANDHKGVGAFILAAVELDRE